jgi:hypothetical protein
MDHKLTHFRPRRPVRRQRVAAAVFHLAGRGDVERRAARFAVILEQESARWGLPSRTAPR